MHTYRAMETDDWRKFLGVTSKHHEHQSNYPVKTQKNDHPIMKGVPKNWITPKDELYIIEKVWPNTTVLATSKSEKTKKSQPVIWTNDYNGTRVFGTTYGHTNETFSDDTFLGLVTPRHPLVRRTAGMNSGVFITHPSYPTATPDATTPNNHFL